MDLIKKAVKVFGNKIGGSWPGEMCVTTEEFDSELEKAMEEIFKEGYTLGSAKGFGDGYTSAKKELD